MTFISGRVEEGLKTEAETKQREEAHAIQLEKKKNPKQSLDGGTLILIGNGFNVFHVVASKVCMIKLQNSNKQWQKIITRFVFGRQNNGTFSSIDWS